MAHEIPTSRSRRESASIGEVVEYVKTYAKQETVGPLKGAGRWIGIGAAAALLLGLGLFLLLLGLLRLIQTEFDGLAEGGSSWVPYGIVLFVCLALLGLALARINKTFLTKEPKD
jgi:hypothetical protein